MWFLADDNNFGDTFGGGLAGPTGLVIILLLVIGTIFLIRSMNARLRRLPASFDEPTLDEAMTSPGADETAEAAGLSDEKAS